MSAKGDRGLDRRSLLAAAGALATEACATCKVPRPLGPLASGEIEIGDTHAHLFNAADLPVVGFLANVLLPKYLPAWEALWPALESLCAGIKTLAMPADEERLNLEPMHALSRAAEVSPQRFSRFVADDIDRHVAARGNAPIALEGRATSIDDSYALLALVLAQMEARQRGLPGPAAPASANGKSALRPIPKVDRRFIEQLALAGSQATPARVDTGALLPGMAPSAEAARELPSISDGAKFIYALIQPRCSHVRQYLRSMSSSETRTTRVVNLLVDYDQWVGDGPAPGSGTVEQLKFWTQYRPKALGRVAVETFAPYDPLRHAEERLGSKAQQGYFARIQSWGDGSAEGIEIAGFKLYPPMGFKAKGNAGEPPTDRAGIVIRDRWTREGWPLTRFGAEIERSLDLFFAYCGERRIPILAHARNSNEASSGAGQNANPAYWLERAKSAPKPLKICLAHFSPEAPPDEWGPAIYETILQSNARKKSEIYFDLAFADELLNGGAKPLLEAVAALCAKADPDCRWFMFGTDWIMLAQLHAVERYIPQLMKAAHELPFWTERRLHNLLHDNMGRYLLRS